MTLPTSPALPARWADILDSVQQALAKAEAGAARAAQALDIAPPVLPLDDWQQRLTELSQPGRHLQACPADADLMVGEIEAVLQASETALREWLAHVDALRRKLANGDDVSV
jgi:hypothetical protein